MQKFSPQAFFIFFFALIVLNPLHAQVICNPLNISYRYQLDEPSRREAADPTMVFFNDTYFLFASKTGGYWWSDDLVNWTLVETNQIPVEDYAPTVVAIGDTLFFLASSRTKCSIYKSTNPKAGKWALVRDTFPITMSDPALFLDNDNRLYFYWGCSDKHPLYAIELDWKKNFEPIGKPAEIIKANTAIHGWENPGDYNQLIKQAPYIEGSWMNKFGTTYYLQYASPGTEYKSYSDGIYVSEHPLGPFILQKHNPFAYKPEGFACGAGHGSTFTDKYGNIWHIATITISVKHAFERRLGLFPAFEDKDGILYTYTGYGDYPFMIPKHKISKPSDLATGWMLLSYNKKITASSSLDAHLPNFASDENIRTFWSANTEKSGEWLKTDLGNEYTINALQVNFAESGSTITGRSVNCFYQYKAEYSKDGKDWKLLIDKSLSKEDLPHDFVLLEEPIVARYLKITGLHVPSGFFAISDLRVFGTGNGPKPPQVTGFRAERRMSDRRIVQLKWDKAKEASGYNIRYGIAKDKLYQNYIAYTNNELIIRSLNSDSFYFFTIEAFNENGIGKSDKIIEIK